ncbi:MAG: hypothetical protein CSA18_01360 [Deltaproteobacteria bacterium]|nr:MAG: hypothetical protein CSA18_01360 [Deltaproteobacteria bacterium]
MNIKALIFLGAIVFLLFNLFFHVWCSGQYNELSFELTKIREKTKRGLCKKIELEAELSMLKSPKRIDELKKHLKLKAPVNEQIEILK